MTKQVAIIGGAGPEAGILLNQQIVRLCQKKYECKRDRDFPYVALFSFPFSEMLESENKIKVTTELTQLIQKECSQAEIWAIACNTLHCYLKGIEKPNQFVHLITPGQKPVVFCSTTSKINQIHRAYFQCDYPEFAIQKVIDHLIDEIVANKPSKETYDQFISLLENYKERQIVLGCTEFSVLNDHFKLPANVLDPLQILAEKICELHFIKN